jgi:hypothetical protein
MSEVPLYEQGRLVCITFYQIMDEMMDNGACKDLVWKWATYVVASGPPK